MLSERSFRSKHSVYYIKGVRAKFFYLIEQALANGDRVEKLSLKDGDRRYYDYEKKRWLKC